MLFVRLFLFFFSFLPAHRSKPTLCCNLLTFGLRIFGSFSLSFFFFYPSFFFSFRHLPRSPSRRSCIEVSSSWAAGAGRVSRKHCGRAHFSQVAFFFFFFFFYAAALPSAPQLPHSCATSANDLCLRECACDARLCARTCPELYFFLFFSLCTIRKHLCSEHFDYLSVFMPSVSTVQCG